MSKQNFEVHWDDDDSEFEEIFSQDGDSSEEFQELLTGEASLEDSEEIATVGMKVQATISYIKSDSEDILLDLGGKASGIISKLDLTDSEGKFKYSVGDVIEAYVISDHDGEIVLSTSMSHSVAKKHSLEMAYKTKIPIKGKVQGHNKGGFEVSILGKKAFCAFSQMDIVFVKNPDEYIGKEFEFIIQKYSSRDFVVSRTQILEEQSRKTLEDLKKNISQNPETNGVVCELKDFGAMVNIGGLIGMIHISEMGFGRPKHPSEVVQIGEKVTVKVLKIDDSGKKPKISLSLKALQEDPWDHISDKYAPGHSSVGTVVRLEKFGAFVKLEEGVEGLIHVSQMSWLKKVQHPKEVLSIGDKLSVRILEIQAEEKRISLSIKSMDEDPWNEHDTILTQGTVHLGTVVELKPFGAIIELRPGLEGMLPIGLIRAAFGNSYRKKCQPKSQLTVTVENCDPQQRRILLGLEMLQKDDANHQDYNDYLNYQKLKSSTLNGTFGELLQASIKKKS